eukprot:gene22026-biopygen17688
MHAVHGVHPARPAGGSPPPGSFGGPARVASPAGPDPTESSGARQSRMDLERVGRSRAESAGVSWNRLEWIGMEISARTPARILKIRARFERSVSNGPGEKSGLAHTSGHAPAQTDARVAAPTHRSDPQLRVRTGWGSPDPGTPRTPNAPRAPHLPAGERSGEPMQNPHKDVRQNAIRPSPDPRADAAPMRRQPNRDTELRPDVGGDQTVCALPVRNQRGFPGELTTLDEVTCAPKPGKVVAHKRPQADRVGRGKDVWGTTVRRHQQQSW